MARLTISLSDETRRALREAAVRQGRTIGEIVEESLELSGIKTAERAVALVRRARASARLEETRALDIAVSETRAERGR
jgi:hypothetical protein